MKKGVLRYFTKFLGKHMSKACLMPKACNFIKKRLWRRCFPVNLAKFLRTTFLQNNPGGMLLTLEAISQK